MDILVFSMLLSHLSNSPSSGAMFRHRLPSRGEMRTNDGQRYTIQGQERVIVTLAKPGYRKR